MLRDFQGIDAKGATIQGAGEIIRSVHWARDTQNIKFTDYCIKHILTNNDLNKYDANVGEAAQVQAF